MAGKRDLRNRVASIFELPGDVMLDVARINIVGDMELVIENHRGIHEYQPDRVVLGSPHGPITISGQDLRIGSISPDQVIILGKISGLHYSD